MRHAEQAAVPGSPIRGGGGNFDDSVEHLVGVWVVVNIHCTKVREGDLRGAQRFASLLAIFHFSLTLFNARS